MITRIFLVRHGATPLTADDRFAGSSDVPPYNDLVGVHA
jgi:broad specificity phosphatase PhoE